MIKKFSSSAALTISDRFNLNQIFLKFQWWTSIKGLFIKGKVQKSDFFLAKTMLQIVLTVSLDGFNWMSIVTIIKKLIKVYIILTIYFF